MPLPTVTLFLLPSWPWPPGLSWHGSGPSVARRITSLACYTQPRHPQHPATIHNTCGSGSCSGQNRWGKQTAFQDGIKSRCLDTLSTMETVCVMQPNASNLTTVSMIMGTSGCSDNHSLPSCCSAWRRTLPSMNCPLPCALYAYRPNYFKNKTISKILT